jgi:nucleoid-associated protein YejK
MKLIREEIEQVEFLVEEDKSTGKKNHFIKGIFIQAELANRNNRLYPFKVLNNEVARYNKEYINKNRAFGELSHPDTPAINLDRVSHMITQLYPDGNNFIGKAKIVDTPMGNIVKGLLDSGANLGVSTRGVGSLKPHNGYQLVQDDFKLSTAADIVADPSAPDAFVRGIMENVSWFYDNGQWKMSEESENVKKTVRKLSQRQIDEMALKLFEQYISKL